MLQKIIIALFFILIQFELQAQNRLENALKAFENDPELKYASISFYAMDMDKKQRIASRNPQLSLPTASTMKAITTGTTLALLGEDYRFETCLEHDGIVVNGVLKGNLYFTGSGDPCLGSPYMEGVPSLDVLAIRFVNILKKKGIKRIDGAIVGDGSYYEVSSLVPTWQWMDMGNHFGAGVSGLNLHDNLYFLTFKQVNELDAQPFIDKIEPKVPNLRFYNEVTSAERNTGDNAYIYSAPYSSQAWVRGTIPVGSGEFKIKGAVPDPPLFAAQWLTQVLKENGIAVIGKPTTQRKLKNTGKRTVIHTHYSPKLADIIKHTNEMSRNLYCESYMKMLGMKIKGEATLDAGIAVVTDFWQKRGVDMRGFFMMDGSGLSARNGVTSKTMTEIMAKMYSDTATFPGYYNLLAVAGKTGTFKYIGRGTALEDNLHGKGGSMNRIRSFTGYIKTRSDRQVAFAIIVNNYTCSGYAIRKRLEKVLLAIAEYSD